MLIDEFNAKLQSAFSNDYRLVFGFGENAPLMLIGEAPGAEEERLGKPFVGKAGKNLDEFLSISGMERNDVYITNAVKFRPSAVSKAGRTVNRTPNKPEIELFRPYLLEEIEIINPKCIVTLGNVPLRAVLGLNASIGDMHARLTPVGKRFLFPMYHPASIIYNRALKQVYINDAKELGRLYKSLCIK